MNWWNSETSINQYLGKCKVCLQFESLSGITDMCANCRRIEKEIVVQTKKRWDNEKSIKNNRNREK